MAEHVLVRHGQVAESVSTPALNIRKRILDDSVDGFDQGMDPNLKGAFHFLRASVRAVTLEPGPPGRLRIMVGHP